MVSTTTPKRLGNQRKYEPYMLEVLSKENIVDSTVITTRATKGMSMGDLVTSKFAPAASLRAKRIASTIVAIVSSASLLNSKNSTVVGKKKSGTKKNSPVVTTLEIFSYSFIYLELFKLVFMFLSLNLHGMGCQQLISRDGN